MANTVNIRTLADGSKVLELQIYLESDGAAGELSDTILVDASTFTPAFTNESVLCVSADLEGFSAVLEWDATTDVPFVALPQGESYHEFRHFGGLVNNAGSGKTGDILITTSGFTAAGDRGSITLSIKKKG